MLYIRIRISLAGVLKLWRDEFLNLTINFSKNI